MKQFYFVLSLLVVFSLSAQDTTRILFIGNSFTYFNNMPDIVKGFASATQRPVITGMHAPGGVSVGDISQGNMAHMNNPLLFSLIRSKAWDVAVIQDNQGRFVRDSAQFPASSLVVQGHLNIMDSVKANNSCAKIVLFGGWAWKNGMPPYGNTGIESIRRILVNYRVLNDTMKETIAPIGEAWIKAVNYLPAVDLWDPDEAHPSYAGSYLTAAAIFSTIFGAPTGTTNYNGSLSAAAASALRAFSDTAVIGQTDHARYNLGGIRELIIQNSGSVLSVTGSYAGYQWYKDNAPAGTGSVLPLSGDGIYFLEAREVDGCVVKSCTYRQVGTGLPEERSPVLSIYPNPVRDGWLHVDGEWDETGLYDICGKRQTVSVTAFPDRVELQVHGLAEGCYLLRMRKDERQYTRKVMIVRN